MLVQFYLLFVFDVTAIVLFSLYMLPRKRTPRRVPRAKQEILILLMYRRLLIDLDIISTACYPFYGVVYVFLYHILFTVLNVTELQFFVIGSIRGE